MKHTVLKYNGRINTPDNKRKQNDLKNCNYFGNLTLFWGKTAKICSLIWIRILETSTQEKPITVAAQSKA
jgi:hypothetical protein